MREFAETCEAVAATTKKTEKVRLVAEYFLRRPDEAAQAAIFLSGRAFPMWEERTLQVGGNLLWRAVAEVSGKGEVALTAAYRRHGDLGAAAADVLARASPAESPLSVAELEPWHNAAALLFKAGSQEEPPTVQPAVLLERLNVF